MARVYKLESLVRGRYGGDWWSLYDGVRMHNVLCHKVLNKLCYIDDSKELDLCISKTKPKHDDYYEYRLGIERGDWLSVEIFYLKINGEWRAVETLYAFQEFLRNNLHGGYIWVEQ